jgi:hypothetical protein
MPWHMQHEDLSGNLGNEARKSEGNMPLGKSRSRIEHNITIEECRLLGCYAV